MKKYQLNLREKNGSYTYHIFYEAEHVNDVQVYFYNTFSRFNVLQSIEEITDTRRHLVWSAVFGYVD